MEEMIEHCAQFVDEVNKTKCLAVSTIMRIFAVRNQ